MSQELQGHFKSQHHQAKKSSKNKPPTLNCDEQSNLLQVYLQATSMPQTGCSNRLNSHHYTTWTITSKQNQQLAYICSSKNVWLPARSTSATIEFVDTSTMTIIINTWSTTCTMSPTREQYIANPTPTLATNKANKTYLHSNVNHVQVYLSWALMHNKQHQHLLLSPSKLRQPQHPVVMSHNILHEVHKMTNILNNLYLAFQSKIHG